MVAAGTGGGESEASFNGYRVSVWDVKEFCGWMVVIVVQQCECI